MTGVRVQAPAKINWTLEVLNRRADGYHEIRGVMQTIALCDSVTIRESGHVSLELGGDVGLLADEPLETNLAFRAAAALREAGSVSGGVCIELEKRIPIAAGLGGGSSDAAAVLRGCNVLWDLRLDDAQLMEIAASLGSDVPFFVACGSALVSGRGERVTRLPDVVAPPLLLATPPPVDRGEKTAAMYAALKHDAFSDGEATAALEQTIEAGRPAVDDQLMNVFERVLTRRQPQTELAMDALRAQGMTPHLAGSGPSFFVLLAPGIDRIAVETRCRELGFEARAVQVMSRALATAIGAA